MGASVSMGHGVQKIFERTGESARTVAVIGDSTFFHSGMTSLLHVAYNRSNVVTCIMDNRTTGMTGHQENPGTGLTLQGEPAKAATCKACHQDEKDFVGPAFKQIAAKYAGNADAVAVLAAKVQKGGTGVWPNAQGKARVMPPNNVTEAEAKALAEWVLAKK